MGSGKVSLFGTSLRLGILNDLPMLAKIHLRPRWE